MEINRAIEDWESNNKDFQQGISILSLIDPGHYWEQFKGAPYASFDQKQGLRKAVLKFKGKNEITIPDPVENITFQDKPKVPQQAQIQTSVPESIVLLKQKCRNIHKTHEHLHAEMVLIIDPKRRHEIAKEIMENIIPELRRNYDMIREWENSGVEPPTAEMDIIKDTTEKAKLIVNSLKPRISRLKGLIKKSKSIDEKKKYETELEEKEVLIQELSEEIGW